MWENKTYGTSRTKHQSARVSLQAALVHTAETTRVKFFMDLLLEKRRPIMLVGNAGTGKTVLMGDKLHGLSEDFIVANVPFNFYTTSGTLTKTVLNT